MVDLVIFVGFVALLTLPVVVLVAWLVFGEETDKDA